MTDDDIKRNILEMLAGSTTDVEREILEKLLERQLRLEAIDAELTRMRKELVHLKQGDDTDQPDKGVLH